MMAEAETYRQKKIRPNKNGKQTEIKFEKKYAAHGDHKHRLNKMSSIRPILAIGHSYAPSNIPFASAVANL